MEIECVPWMQHIKTHSKILFNHFCFCTGNTQTKLTITQRKLINGNIQLMVKPFKYLPSLSENVTVWTSTSICFDPQQSPAPNYHLILFRYSFSIYIICKIEDLQYKLQNIIPLLLSVPFPISIDVNITSVQEKNKEMNALVSPEKGNSYF